MKKILIFLMAASFIGLAANEVMAGGNTLFIQKCGSCHKSGGKAEVINPADKAGRVWQKYFKRGRHPVDTGISDSDMAAIITYLTNHAADSDQPEAAIIPK